MFQAGSKRRRSDEGATTEEPDSKIQKLMEDDEISFLEEEMLKSGCRKSLFKLCLSSSYNYQSKKFLNGATLLHEACRLGHLDVVRALVEVFHFPLTVIDDHGNSPCHLACEAGQLKIMDYFDKCPFMLFYKSKNKFGDTLLHMACKSGSVPLVRMIIAGSLVDATFSTNFASVKCNEYYDAIFTVERNGYLGKLPTNSSGSTPLHVACSSNCIEIVKFFFNEFQNVYKAKLKDLLPSLINLIYEKKNDRLLSYLFSCVGDCLSFVLKTFEDFSRRHGFQGNLLNLTHAKYQQSGQVDETLCSLGSKYTFSLQDEHPIFAAARQGNIKKFEFFSKVISNKKIYSARNALGDTILHAACVSCSEDLVKKLYYILIKEQHFKRDELYNITNCFGYTCLHIVCEHGSLGLVKFFIQVGFSVNAVTSVGHTPIHLSIIYERKMVFDELMENHYIDINAKSNSGETPLHIAASEQARLEYVIKIIKHSAFNSADELDCCGESPLFNACRTHSKELVDTLLNEPANSNVMIVNKKKETVAVIAMRYHWKELIDILLKNPCYKKYKPQYSLFESINYCDGFDDTNDEEKSHSLTTVITNQCSMIKHLLKNEKQYSYSTKDDVNTINANTGFTLLQQACRCNNITQFQQLLSIDSCDCDIKGTGGNTVLHICCEKNLINFVRLCLHKCSIVIRNDKLDTPLHVALENKNYELAKYIISQVQSERLDNFVNDKGNNILHIVAAKDETHDILTLILSKNCIDHKSKNIVFGNTALHIAFLNRAFLNIKHLFKEDYDATSWYNKKFESPLLCLLTSHSDFDWLKQVVEVIPRKYLATYNMTRSSRYRISNSCDDIDIPMFLYFIIHYCQQGCFHYNQCNQTVQKFIPEYIKIPGVNVIDSHGNTIFHYLAASRYHACQFNDIIDRLFEKYNHIVTNLNEFGESALHIAGKYHHEWFTKKIIDHGVPLEFINMKSSSGRVIHMFGMGNPPPPICNYLIAKGSKHNLKTKVSPSSDTLPTLHIAVVGNSGVGKTTLVNSLKCLNDISIDSTENCTIGIVPSEIIKDGHCYKFYDFAGQIEYETGHAKFLKNLMSSASECSVENVLLFLVMVKGTTTIEENKGQITYWLEFLRQIASDKVFSIYAMLLCSHADKFESDEMKSNFTEKLTNFFSGQKVYPLKLKDTCICMNCQNLNNKVMDSKSFKKLMGQLEEKCSSLINFPLSSGAIELSVIIKNNFTNTPCQFKDVIDIIMKERTFGLAEDGRVTMEGNPLVLSEVPELLVPYLEELHIQTTIMLLKSSEECQNWWIVNKCIQEDLFSKANSIFSPSDEEMKLFIDNNTGVVPHSKLKSFFKKENLNFNFEVLLSYLMDMEYCILIEKEIVDMSGECEVVQENNEEDKVYYFFPGLITGSRNSKAYTEKRSRNVFFGFMMSSKFNLGLDFLHTVLLRLTFNFTSQKDPENKYERKLFLWKNGISWSTKDSVDILIEISQNHEVIFLIRGNERHSVAKHTSKVIWEVRKIREKLIKANRDISSLKEHCILPPPTHYDFLEEQNPASCTLDSKKFFSQGIDCRKEVVELSNGEHESFPLLSVDPYAELDFECICKLNSEEILSEDLPEYILRILHRERSKVTDLSYSNLCSILDKYSIFRGEELATILA